MLTYEWKEVLEEASAHALAFLEGLPQRRVGSTASLRQLRFALGGPVPEQPTDPREVVATLASATEAGLVAMPSGRYFGFVIGGVVPASVGADWLATAWDQNAGLFSAAPAAAVAEEAAASWLLDLLGLPKDASVGFVTGAQMASFTCLAAARHAVLRAIDWDVEREGLSGAPRISVLAGRHRHVTIDRALRFLGLGTGSVEEIEVDGRGRMLPDALARSLRSASGPVIVCAQIGDVNTGAIDPVGEIADIAHQRAAWVHVDGAFGLWAAASPSLREHVLGMERADSWATDAHKWLNVPYDSGIAISAHPEDHRAAMEARAAYLMRTDGAGRNPMDWNPEFSRRARGFAVWAAIRSLGRSGIAEIVDRCCAMARRFANALVAVNGVTVINEVVLNQVLVRFDDDDEVTKRVVEAVQADGTCWLSGTRWRGMQAMRISVSNWSTDEDDVDRSVQAILRSFRQEQVRFHPSMAPGTKLSQAPGRDE